MEARAESGQEGSECWHRAGKWVGKQIVLLGKDRQTWMEVVEVESDL